MWEDGQIRLLSSRHSQCTMSFIPSSASAPTVKIRLSFEEPLLKISPDHVANGRVKVTNQLQLWGRFLQIL